MSKRAPELEDYLRIFDMYPADLSAIYKDEGSTDHYALLFEQLMHMLVRQSRYNSSLPLEFVLTAQRYVRGESETMEHLGDMDNRHFMLCDLYDFIMLNGGLNWKREHGGS